LNLIWELTLKSLKEWSKDRAGQLAAAIAFYTIFSIPPLLIITLSITGYFYNTSAAQIQLLNQMVGFVGPQTTDFVRSLLENATQTSTSPLTSIFSLIILLIGASGVFYQVQNALNTIWDIPKEYGGIYKTLKNRLQSFLMVLAIGFLLLIFLLLSALASVFIGYVNIGPQNMLIPEFINFILLFVTITILFAMIYRVIPDKDIKWRDVWLGATVTAFLFMIGRYAIGLFLLLNNSASTYGAAGSLIVLLLWIYYSAQIFLLGAEFTQVYSRKFGSQKKPGANPASLRKKDANLTGSHD
jgi:membrane protein